MVYYVLLWFARKCLIGEIGYAFVLVSAVILLAYWYFPYKYETGELGIYGVTTLFRWIPYLGVMFMELLSVFFSTKMEIDERL